MNSNGTIVIILVILVVVGGFFLWRNCQSKSVREGYVRACLGGDCYGLQRTPVDYAEKFPHGWQRNPHYRTYPPDKYQPLNYGPIDFYPDTRRLDKYDGVLFQQYGNYWRGIGRDIHTLANDSKNRFDMTNIGDYGARQVLDDMYNPRFGPKGFSFTERTLDEPNPYFGKLYGGSAFLTSDKLGD